MATKQPVRHKFSADEFIRMSEVGGILPEDERVELIEGEILDMAALGNRHMAAVDRLNRWFVRKLGDEAIVRIQGAVRLNDRNVPQPDLLVLRWREDFYEDASAGPGDVLLAIEVSDSTLAFDRDFKG